MTREAYRDASASATTAPSRQAGRRERGELPRPKKRRVDVGAVRHFLVQPPRPQTRCQ